MVQVYVIYLRSNLTVHDVLSTRRTAAEDFKQFSNPKPDSYVDRRKRARPDLFTDMNDVDFLVLQPPSSWSNQDRGDPIGSWRSRPTEVVAVISSSRASNGFGALPIATSAALAAPSALKTSRPRLFTEKLRASEITDHDVEVELRWNELLNCTTGRPLHPAYPPEVLHDFKQVDGTWRYWLYLAEAELIELREIFKHARVRGGLNPECHWIDRINQLLAVHEQFRLAHSRAVHGTSGSPQSPSSGERT